MTFKYQLGPVVENNHEHSLKYSTVQLQFYLPQNGIFYIFYMLCDFILDIFTYYLLGILKYYIQHLQ